MKYQYIFLDIMKELNKYKSSLKALQTAPISLDKKSIKLIFIKYTNNNDI